MATLSLTPVDLVSVQSAVPLRGAPSSQDYNDNQNNMLVDLASIVSFLNGTVVPLLEALPEFRLPDYNADGSGIEGRTVNTDLTDRTPLCFNALTSTPLTVAESMAYLQNVSTSMSGTMTDLKTQVAVLSSQLSSTNQNDISTAIQGFQTALNQVNAKVLVLQGQNTNSQAPPMTTKAATPTVNPKGTETMTVAWPIPFTNDTYTALCSMEDLSGFLQIVSWAYVSGGSGINVVVRNNDTAAAHSGILHALAFPF